MKRTLRLAALGVGCVLALTFASAVSADVIQQTNEPYGELAFNQCTDEAVILEGTVHSVTRLSFSPDGRTHFGASSSFSALKGTTVGGARYVETRIENFGGNFDSDFAPAEFTTETLQVLTRLAEDGTYVDGDDLRVHVSAHMTVNANGTTTVDHTDSTVECR